MEPRPAGTAGARILSGQACPRSSSCDVAATLRASPGRFDAVLLDVDNGPDAFTACRTPGCTTIAGWPPPRSAQGRRVLAVWSAWEDCNFEQRLRYAAFTVEVERVRGRLKQGGPRHTLFLAHPSAGHVAHP